MNASKENARKSLKDVEQVALGLDGLPITTPPRDRLKAYLLRIEAFLEAAEVKLPTEASFKRDKQRRQTRVQAKKTLLTVEYAGGIALMNPVGVSSKSVTGRLRAEELAFEVCVWSDIDDWRKGQQPEAVQRCRNRYTESDLKDLIDSLQAGEEIPATYGG